MMCSRMAGSGGVGQPRSPNVTPLDFFLWGYVKTKVFTEEIADIEELKTRITHAVASVTPQMLLNTWKEFEKRLLKLRENGGFTC